MKTMMMITYLPAGNGGDCAGGMNSCLDEDNFCQCFLPGLDTILASYQNTSLNQVKINN